VCSNPDHFTKIDERERLRTAYYHKTAKELHDVRKLALVDAKSREQERLERVAKFQQEDFLSVCRHKWVWSFDGAVNYNRIAIVKLLTKLDLTYAVSAMVFDESIQYIYHIDRVLHLAQMRGMSQDIRAFLQMVTPATLVADRVVVRDLRDMDRSMIYPTIHIEPTRFRAVDYLHHVKHCSNRHNVLPFTGKTFTFKDGSTIKMCPDCTRFDRRRAELLGMGAVEQADPFRLKIWNDKLRELGLSMERTAYDPSLLWGDCSDIAAQQDSESNVIGGNRVSTAGYVGTEHEGSRTDSSIRDRRAEEVRAKQNEHVPHTLGLRCKGCGVLFAGDKGSEFHTQACYKAWWERENAAKRKQQRKERKSTKGSDHNGDSLHNPNLSEEK
jgi:hypothetical protein